MRYAAHPHDAVPGLLESLDATHPLGFGLEGGYYTLKRRGYAFDYLKDGWNVGVLEEGAPVSGFVGSAAQERLAEAALLGAIGAIGGVVLALAAAMVANAVFLVGQR